MSVFDDHQALSAPHELPALRWVIRFLPAQIAALRARQADRKKERILQKTMSRLQETSPHLLADIGMAGDEDCAEHQRKHHLSRKSDP